MFTWLFVASGIKGWIKVSKIPKLISSNILHDWRVCRSQCDLSFGEESIKVFRWSRVFYDRNEWRLNWSTFNPFPVNPSEEGMIHDVNLFRGSWSESFVRVLDKKSFANFFWFLWHEFWIRYILFSDGSKQFFFIFSIKRRLPNNHFIQKHSICPPKE